MNRREWSRARRRARPALEVLAWMHRHGWTTEVAPVPGEQGGGYLIGPNEACLRAALDDDPEWEAIKMDHLFRAEEIAQLAVWVYEGTPGVRLRETILEAQP